MAKLKAALVSFNRGIVSKKALARVDIERLRLSAEIQTNFIPTVLGPMTIRPGTEYIGSTKSDAAMWPVPFVFSNSDTAILELTDSVMRVRVADDLVVFLTVATVVTNGDFASATGWTLANGGASTAAISGSKLTFTGASVNGIASAERSVTVAGGDHNVRHCFKIVVTQGPVNFRAGTASGLDDYIAKTTLDTGTHFLAFTPVGNVVIYFESTDLPSRIVSSIAISVNTLEVPTPWTASDLPYLRPVQSADVVFVACRGMQQRRIERRAVDSWSIVLYKPNDGPFGTTDGSVSITPNALTGDVTLTASRAFFRSTNVGSLFRLFHDGQQVATNITAQNAFSNTIRVTGVGAARSFQYAITGTYVATWTLQRSFESATTGFADVSHGDGSGAGPGVMANSGSISDGFDNSIAYYRFGVKTGDFTSGTVAISLNFSGGGGAGICRVTAYSSATSVAAEVLSPFSNITASTDWLEGVWSNRREWPSAVAFHEGRLWWAAGDHIWGSVSDDYTSFDYDATGDAAPVDRTIGYGPVDAINWLLPLHRLVIGREGSEISARSSSLDEPLTPTNFTLKDCATLGSARLPAVKVDARGIFVQQSGKRIYSLNYQAQAGDYQAQELTRLAADICTGAVMAIAVQRQPDTRIHFVLFDGTVVVLTYDVEDDVVAWWVYSTAGLVENVVVLPGAPDDLVYYVVKRTINGVTKRYLEKQARADQCSGLPDCRLADAHVLYEGGSGSVSIITGLEPLEGKTVVVWGYDTGDTTGKDLGTYTVSAGTITLSDTVIWACIGLGYTAFFKSAKLAYGAVGGTALTQTKRIERLGLILLNTHYQGLLFGTDFVTMDNLPLVEDGAVTDADTVWPDFDGPMVAIPGTWDTDSRLCLQAAAPRPCTVLAAVVAVMTNE